VAITYDELARNTESWVGRNVRLQGKVVQVMESGGSMDLRVNVTKGSYGLWSDTVYLRFTGPRLLEGDLIEFTARVNGRVTYKTVLGASVTIPDLTALSLSLASPTSTPPVSAAPSPPAAAPPIPGLPKNATATLQGKWQITYVGEFRDKAIYFYDTSKVAFGVWATVQFRVKNLQSGTDHLGATAGFVAIDPAGNVIEEAGVSGRAAWMYCGCDTVFSDINPGQEKVIVVTFDVPDGTTSLTIALTTSAFSSTPLREPRWQVANFDRVPAFKPK
jgi:hypothetical protein